MKFDYRAWIEMLAQRDEVVLSKIELSLLSDLGEIMDEIVAGIARWRAIADDLADGYTLVCSCDEDETCKECAPLDAYMAACNEMDAT